MLISIAVITYNSSKYVVELLDSIFNQTYERGIELIISDDGSSDDTVEICHEWLKKNNGRFYRTELLSVGVNTGLTKNLNRACKACNGEWIKPIAGDDALLSNALIEYYNATKQTSLPMIFSRVQTFSEKEGDLGIFPSEKNCLLFNLSANQKLDYLVGDRNFLPAPAHFINKKFLEKMGFFDERIEMMEDYPFWIKVLSSGYDFFFINKALVKYRINDDSISFDKGNKNYSMYYINSMLGMMHYYLLPYALRKPRYFYSVCVRYIRFLRFKFFPKQN